jgi:hypothetical protein
MAVGACGLATGTVGRGRAWSGRLGGRWLGEAGGMRRRTCRLEGAFVLSRLSG